MVRGVVGIEEAWGAEDREMSERGPSGWGQGRGIGGQAQVPEDPGDDGRIGDEREDEHGGGTAGAREGIDEEDATESAACGVAVVSNGGAGRSVNPPRACEPARAG
jgi:hypothetical protein